MQLATVAIIKTLEKERKREMKNKKQCTLHYLGGKERNDENDCMQHAIAYLIYLHRGLVQRKEKKEKEQTAKHRPHKTSICCAAAVWK